jgi:hypothetical protein
VTAPAPWNYVGPAAVTLDRVRSLVAGGHVHHALEVAVAAAVRKGIAALDEARRPADRGTSAEKFLRAVRAAAGALEGIGLALAAGERPAD